MPTRFGRARSGARRVLVKGQESRTTHLLCIRYIMGQLRIGEGRHPKRLWLKALGWQSCIMPQPVVPLELKARTRARPVSTIFWICGTGGSFLIFVVLGVAYLAWDTWDAAQYPDGDGQAGAAIGFVVWVSGAAVALVWGCADGWRGRSLLEVLVRWGLAGLASFVGEMVYAQVMDSETFWLDSALRGLVISGLCVIGAGLGWLVGGHLPADSGGARLRVLPWADASRRR